MSSSNDIDTYNSLFADIEKCYLENKHDQIINLKNARTDIDFLNTTKPHYFDFAEIFAISYIELNLFQKALVIIDNYLQYLYKIGNSAEEYDDDLTIFFLLKIEIYNRQNSNLKAYKSVLKYVNCGGNDDQILDLIPIYEDALYLKYVQIHKVLLYLTLGISVISLLWSLAEGQSFRSILTTVFYIWFLLNWVFYKKIKQYYIILLRKILA